MSIEIIMGKHWKFVPKWFLSPPREFKYLYGSEVRQTTMENFINVEKRVFPVVKVVKKEKIYVQSTFDKFFLLPRGWFVLLKLGRSKRMMFSLILRSI